jgi:hypothetical protein
MADPSLAGLVNVLSASNSGVLGGQANPKPPVSVQQLVGALGGWPAVQPGVPAKQHGLAGAWMNPFGSSVPTPGPTPLSNPWGTTPGETRTPGATNPVVPPPYIGGGGETRIPNPAVTPPPGGSTPPKIPNWVGGTVDTSKMPTGGLAPVPGTPNYTQYAPYGNTTKNFSSYPEQKQGETLYEYAVRTAPQTGFSTSSLGSLGMRTSSWFENGANPDFRQVIDSVINPWAYMSSEEQARQNGLEDRDRASGSSSVWDEARNRPATSWTAGGYPQEAPPVTPPPEAPPHPGEPPPTAPPPATPPPAVNPYVPPETVNPEVPVTPPPSPTTPPENAPHQTPSGKSMTEVLEWTAMNGGFNPQAAAVMYNRPESEWPMLLAQYTTTVDLSSGG